MSFPALVWAMKQPVGDAYEKAVLWVLADAANKNRRHTASLAIATIAERCGMGDSGVRAAIGRLVQRGLIERNGSTIRRRYRILLEEPLVLSDAEDESADAGAERRDTVAERRDAGAGQRQSGTDPNPNQLGAAAPAAGESKDENQDEDDAQPRRKRRRKRATRLSPDWQPGAQEIAWAKDNRPAVDWREEAEKFRNYWIAKAGRDAAKSDWFATWRNWIINAAKYQARLGGSAPVTGTSGAEPWQLRLKAFDERKFWRANWGPPPDAAGCRAPQSILARFGYGAAAG